MKLLFQGKTGTKVPAAGCVLLERELVPASSQGSCGPEASLLQAGA